jgi:hypothetical protein
MTDPDASTDDPIWQVPSGDLLYDSLHTDRSHVLLRVERRMI